MAEGLQLLQQVQDALARCLSAICMAARASPQLNGLWLSYSPKPCHYVPTAAVGQPDQNVSSTPSCAFHKCCHAVLLCGCCSRT
jgi:hypothetical protein